MILCSVALVHAQESEPVVLEHLLRQALRANPDIQAAERRASAASAASDYASALPDPMFSYTRWTRSVETRVGPQENVFALSQRIPFPGKLDLQGKIAGQDAKAAQHAVKAARLNVTLKVKSAYADLYRIDRSLAILDEYESLLNDFSAVAATKYAAGQGTQAQVLKADVEISSIAVQKLNFEKMRTGAVAHLNALMDKPSEAPIGKVAQLDTTMMLPDAQELVARALANRPDVQTSQEMVAKAEFARKLAQKSYYPDLNVQATYITIPKLGSAPADAGKDPFSLMVGINLPIWFGKQRARVEQAQATSIAEERRQRSLQNSVEAEITDLLFQLQMIRQTLLLYEQGLLIQAESSLESALSAYKTGTLDFLNLLDAERTLLQFRLAYVNELANYFKQTAALERAVGGKL